MDQFFGGPAASLTSAQFGALTNPITTPAVDTTHVTVTAAHANLPRAPSGSLTYTINAATAWALNDGAIIYLPTTGTVSFAVSGAGVTLNGATATLTRTLALNPTGMVGLFRIQGTDEYGLTGG